jgi:hypothetical protein
MGDRSMEKNPTFPVQAKIHWKVSIESAEKKHSRK